MVDLVRYQPGIVIQYFFLCFDHTEQQKREFIIYAHKYMLHVHTCITWALFVSGRAVCSMLTNNTQGPRRIL